MTEKSVYKQQFTAPKTKFNFPSQKQINFLSWQRSVPFIHGCTTLLHPCTNFVDSGFLQIGFGLFCCPKMMCFTRGYNSKFSKMTTKISNWYKTLQWERQISTISCDWEISLSIRQKTFIEKKTWTQSWYQQRPKTWMNTSNWLTSWLTMWIGKREKFVWFCWGLLWTNQRVHMLNSNHLQGRMRTRGFSKLSMWTIKLQNFLNNLM